MTPRMTIGRRGRWLLLALLPVGAACDPLIDVAGAFFPAWILCIVIAIVVTTLVRLVFVRTRVEPVLAPLVILYPSLATAIALGCWLLFFRR
jgi:hypothetical protein